MTDQICDNCGKPNPPEESYCYACGHILPTGLHASATRSLDHVDNLKPQIRWGTAYFGDQTVLRMRVRDSGTIFEVQFIEEIVFGRAHDEIVPDVDLSPYGAMKLGVSRKHVKLRRETATVMVQDLGSRNGTFLNGSRLVPYQPRVLRNEDELRLGHLVLRVSFMRAPGSTEPLDDE
jgi:hypothetical protein